MLSAPLLTFDDGPSESTEEILDLLGEYRLHATFFVIGCRAEQRPELVKRAADEGHVVANHTWDHVALAQILNDAKSADDLTRRAAVVGLKLQQANNAIATILGAPPTLFRGPWLSVDDRVIQIAGALGLSHVGVDVDTGDYAESRSEEDVATAILGATAGQIILLHDGTGDVIGGNPNPPRPKTVDAVRRALPEFAEHWGEAA